MSGDEARALHSGVLSSDAARRLLEEALGSSRAPHTEALLTSRSEALTRFANNAIHQNVAAVNHSLTLRAVEGDRSGLATTNRLDAMALRELADQALAMARLSPEDPDSPPLGGPQRHPPLEAWREATATLPPEARARGAGAAIAAGQARGLTAAGAFTTAARSVAIANSRGRFAYHASTYARFTRTMLGPDSSGWTDRHRRDAEQLEPAALGEIAARKAEGSARPAALDPGPYTVVLEPAAVAELLSFLAWSGLGARSLQEGRSFLTGRMGERVTGERITLRDDAGHPLGLGQPFDWEGTPRRPVTLIENGVARAVVHDRRTALKEGVESTGHAMPPPAPDGPQPCDLLLEPGNDTLEALVASTERGVLVTRFWYNRLVDQRLTRVTGMTRDGTFLIEGGRLTRGVRNLRFNESVLGVLERADGIGRDLEPTVFEWAGHCVLAPALKVREFHFTSVTRY